MVYKEALINKTRCNDHDFCKGRNLGTFCCQDFDAEGDNAKKRCCESDLEMIMPNTEGGRATLSALLLKMDDKKREEICRQGSGFIV